MIVGEKVPFTKLKCLYSWNVQDDSSLFPWISYQTSEIFLFRGVIAVLRFRSRCSCPVLGNKNAQHLILQAVRSDHEIQQRDLHFEKPSGMFQHHLANCSKMPQKLRIISWRSVSWPERRSPVSSEDLATSWWWKVGTLHCTPRWSLRGGSWTRVDLVWWNGFWSAMAFTQKNVERQTISKGFHPESIERFWKMVQTFSQYFTNMLFDKLLRWYEKLIDMENWYFKCPSMNFKQTL